MALNPGQVAYLEVSDDDGTSYSPVGKLDNVTLNINAGEIEAPHYDDDGWTPYLDGKKDATIEFSAKLDIDDPGQDILLGNYFDGDEIKAKWAMVEGTGNPEYEALVTVTSASQESPDNDVQMLTGTLRIREKPSVTEQT